MRSAGSTDPAVARALTSDRDAATNTFSVEFAFKSAPEGPARTPACGPDGHARPGDPR